MWYTYHTIHLFLVCSKNNATTTTVAGHSSCWRGSMHTLVVTPILPCSPKQLLIYVLFLPICLFWTCHINGIRQYTVCCVWLLALSILFSKFIHAVAWISTFCFDGQILFLFVNILHFIHSSVDGYLDDFYFLAIMNNSAMNILWRHLFFPTPLWILVILFDLNTVGLDVETHGGYLFTRHCLGLKNYFIIAITINILYVLL